MSEQGDQGERGVVGERGESGDRGIAGERGPKGDHGQHGDPGPQGPAGAVVHDEKRERGRDRKALYQAATLLAFPLAVVALIPSLYGFYRVQNNQEALEREVDRATEARRQTTYQLCLLSKTNRDELRTFIQGASSLPRTSLTAAERDAREQFYLDSLKRLPPVKCVKPGGRVVPPLQP